MASGTTYRIDADDRIVEIGAGWDDFALANDSPQLGASAVIGTRLWDHVSDLTTRDLLSQILRRVRAAGREVEIPFRCDSPSVRRFMSFHVEPLAEGAVRVTTRLLYERPYTRPVPMQPADARDAGVLRMCSWCNRVEAEGRWLDLEDAVRALGLFARPAVPPISHGMCASCEDQVSAQLDREFGDDPCTSACVPPAG